MSVTIEEIKQYEAVKKAASDLGMELGLLGASSSFSVNPPGGNGLVVYKDLGNMEIFLYGYTLGRKSCQDQR